MGLHGYPVNQIDVFDLTNNTWSTLPSSADLPELRGGPMAAIQPNAEGHHQLNVWGGEFGGGAYSTGRGLDLTTNTWITLPPLPTTLHATQIVQVSPDSLVMIAGAINGGTEIDVSTSAYVKRYESAPVAFPVSWISVQSDWDAETQTALIRWEVNEEQVQHYDVLLLSERSAVPTMLGRVLSRGNGLSAYEFSDRMPPETGTLQYSIRSVDFDGSVSYSPIVTLTVDIEPIKVYSTWPGASDRSLMVRGAVPTSATIFSLDGRSIWSTLLSGNTWTIPQGIPAATYLLRISLEGGRTFATKIFLQ